MDKMPNLKCIALNANVYDNIDEEALTRALDEKILSGTGLEVLSELVSFIDVAT